MNSLINKIRNNNCVTFELREKYFKGKSFKEIRNWLEANGIDRHIPIDFKTAGVLIYINIPNGNSKVLVQVRSTEKYRLGIFGGAIEDDETPTQAAIRELREETGIETCEEQLEFLEINEHKLEYKNGDKTNYISSVYVLKLNEFPFIRLDSESNGIVCISKENYKEFMYNYQKESLQLYKFWNNTVLKVLNIDN